MAAACAREESNRKESFSSFEKTFVHLRAHCQVKEAKFDLFLANDQKGEDDEFKSFGYPYAWIQIKGSKPILAMKAMQFNSLLFLDKTEVNRGEQATGCDHAFAISMSLFE